MYLLKNIPPDWTYDPRSKSIHRKFVFEGFDDAFAFMSIMASFSTKHDHHPHWENVYNILSISLTTHDQDAVTERDIQWATEANRLFRLINPPTST